jgi:hypothetical protein
LAAKLEESEVSALRLQRDQRRVEAERASRSDAELGTRALAEQGAATAADFQRLDTFAQQSLERQAAFETQANDSARGLERAQAAELDAQRGLLSAQGARRVAEDLDARRKRARAAADELSREEEALDVYTGRGGR